VKIVFVTLFTSFLFAAASTAREALDKPNVIIIYLDDSGYGDYAHNGNPVVRTTCRTSASMRARHSRENRAAACSAM
jgi:hypothetical protein